MIYSLNTWDLYIEYEIQSRFWKTLGFINWIGFEFYWCKILGSLLQYCCKWDTRVEIRFNVVLVNIKEFVHLFQFDVILLFTRQQFMIVTCKRDLYVRFCVWILINLSGFYIELEIWCYSCEPWGFYSFLGTVTL